MGALVTLDLPADAPALTLPWIITIGPLRDEDQWEAVVCGPYERPHAMALAEQVVAHEDLMAVVEPLQPYSDVQKIRDDVAAARLAAVETADLDEELARYDDNPYDFSQPEEYPDRIVEDREPVDPPTPEEVRAGIARIAALLTA